MTMLEMMRVADMMVTRKILPLLAGNFPRMIQYYSRLRQPQLSSIAQDLEVPSPQSEHIMEAFGAAFRLPESV